MSRIPSGTEQVRPFLPSQDFDLSKRFYEALGFVKILDGDVAIFETGSSGFILQNYYKKEWAENFMMQLLVDDLDAWWLHITTWICLETSAYQRRNRRQCNRGDFALLMLSIPAVYSGTSRSGPKPSRRLKGISSSPQSVSARRAPGCCRSAADGPHPDSSFADAPVQSRSRLLSSRNPTT
jgi:hypothetical protein